MKMWAELPSPGIKNQVTMDEETLAFEELSKLSVNDSTTSIESSLKKENFNVVFVGHVGKKNWFLNVEHHFNMNLFYPFLL